MTKSDHSRQRRFIVEYALNYQHRVQVGLYADDAKTAKQIAEARFDEGTIWDDTADCRLLFDDFEEDGGNVLEFCVVAADLERFPTPDCSVRGHQAPQLAMRAVRMLFGHPAEGQLDPVLKAEAIRLAKLACALDSGRLVSMGAAA